MKSDYQNNIIGRIRKLREEFQYSQEDMATMLGLSNGHIGNIESLKSNHKYTLNQILRICREFNYPIEHIFLNDEDYKANIDIVSKVIEKIVQYEEQKNNY